MVRRSASFLLVALASAAPRALAAQSPVDAAALGTLDLAIGTDRMPASVALGDGVARQVEQGLRDLDAYLRANDRRALERALFRFDQAAARRPDWPWPEYAMAHAFLMLHDLGAPTTGSEGLISGETHLAAMWRHLYAALRRDGDFAPARVLLVELAYAGGDRELHDDMEAALAQEVSRKDPLPKALVIWARQKRAQGEHAIALAILDRAGQLGADPGVVALERARCLEALDRPDDARRAYWQGADAPTADGRQLYRQDLGWILDDDSLAAFDAVPDGEMGSWLRRFWAGRDAAVVDPPLPREVEHLRRWIYAFAHFRVEAPWTRIPRTRVDFAFDDILDQCVGNATPFYQQLPILPPALPGDVRINETLLDHRGIIYLRHGEPFARAVPPSVLADDPAIAAEAAAGIVPGQERSRLAESLADTEVWVYWVEGRWRVFQFRGSDALGHDGATTMSSYLPWQSLQAWEALARMLPAYQAAANVVRIYRGGNPRPTCMTALHQAVLRQREDAVVGINTDTERPPILEPWNAVQQFFAIEATAGRPARALVTFSIPTSRLAGRELEGGAMLWSIRFRVVAWRGSDGTRIDLDTTRTFLARQPEGEGFLAGWLEVPLSPGSWQFAMLARQPGDTTAGSYALRRTLTVGASGAIGMGDLLTGRAGQAAWDAPDGPFPINATGLWADDQPVELWYQVTGLAAGDDYRTTVEVVPDDSRHAESIKVTTQDRAAGPVTIVRRTLGLDQLSPGGYRVIVTVAKGDVTVQRAQPILVAKRGG